MAFSLPYNIANGQAIDANPVMANFNALAAIAPISGGAAASAGANSDITSLSALSTPLSIPQGGTGANTAAAARTALAVPQIGPAFSASRITTAQSIANGAFTEVVFNSAAFDTATCFNVSTGRFTPNVAGYYQINATLQLTTPSGTIPNGQVVLYKNGAVYASLLANLGYPSTLLIGGGGDVVYLNGTTDYVSVFAYINSSTGTQSVGTSSMFSGVFVRPT
jgi:C1q domain